MDVFVQHSFTICHRMTSIGRNDDDVSDTNIVYETVVRV